MIATLIELSLRESQFSGAKLGQSFNGDSPKDTMRNSFCESIPSYNLYSERVMVSSEYLYPNVYHYDSNQIFELDDKIIVGEYCNDGVIVPRTHSIIFNQLYNCSPLISLIKGDEEYISFLHTWAIKGDSDVVDKQVKHWMKTIEKLGDVSETIFAPRKCSSSSDTLYKTAISDITKISQKSIVFNRDLGEIIGVVNEDGVYFKNCGYHLWGN